MPTIVPATSSGTTDSCLRLETQRIGTKYPASRDYPQTEPEFPPQEKEKRNGNLKFVFLVLIKINYLDDDIFLERLGRIESFDNGIRARVFDGRSAKLDRFLEHADDEIAVKEVLARLRVHKSQIVVVSVGALVASLADVQRRAAGRYPRHGVVAILSAVIAAVENDTSRVVSSADTAKI